MNVKELIGFLQRLPPEMEVRRSIQMIDYPVNDVRDVAFVVNHGKLYIEQYDTVLQGSESLDEYIEGRLIGNTLQPPNGVDGTATYNIDLNDEKVN